MSFLHPTPLKCGNGGKNFLDRLVCRAWVPSSRRILFYRVQILKETAYNFARLFTKPDRLTFLSFIREIVFKCDIVEHGWMFSVLPKIVQHLPRTVYLLSYNIRRRRGPESPLPCPPLRGITHLDISDINEPQLADVVHCIASFPALQALKLWLPVSRLALFSPDTMFANDEGEAKYMSQYIEGLGTSLTSLTLGFDETWTGDINKFLEVAFLQANTALKALSIQCTCEKTISLLKTMHVPPSLKCLTVAYIEQTRTCMPVGVDIGLVAPTARLITHLELMHVYRYNYPSEMEPPKGQMLLPRCAERGLVVVETELEDVHCDWIQEMAYWR
ncbi:hypothetical protein B0H13DRAFT_1993694 [Mycena leptocephala]|nr:hypothetical protein B0H13DRAFT_1993694 [Mycena leptocephala]